MGAIAFLVLFILGLLLAITGSIVGIVDAFRVSPVWGLLSLLVPFALLVFCIKFWGRKWARNSLILSLGGLGTMLLSTPFMGLFLAQRSGEMDAAVVEPLPGEALPGEPVPIPDEQVVTDQEFAEPLVPVAPQLSPIARADLIQSTDANERLQQISDGRTDPFATVPIPPPPQIIAPPPPPGGSPTPGAPAAGTTAVAPGTPGVAPGATTPGGTGLPPTATTPGTPGAASPGATPGVPGAGQPAAGTPPPLAPLPALPQPTLAQAVQVTGVMTIGSENFAVVQTGSGSQYVRAGQRVSNGQVLVKRIDMRGSEPTVVLEENGIEVSRPVGPPVTADEQPSA